MSDTGDGVNWIKMCVLSKVLPSRSSQSKDRGRSVNKSTWNNMTEKCREASLEEAPASLGNDGALIR